MQKKDIKELKKELPRKGDSVLMSGNCSQEDIRKLKWEGFDVVNMNNIPGRGKSYKITRVK